MTMDTPAIHIEGLRKAFGENQVLDGIDLRVEQAGIYAVLGPNGSGKTTLIKCLLGLVIPDEGSLRFRGKEVAGRWSYRAAIDYLPQIARFPENLRVEELLRMVEDLRPGKTRREELVDRFELADHLGQRMGKLSGGTRQKVNLVTALMSDSPCIVLDEPTSGLDPVALIRLKEFLHEEKARGKVLLMTTHIMDFVEEMADELVFLLDARLRFRGSPGELCESYGEARLEAAIARLLQGASSAPSTSENQPARS